VSDRELLRLAEIVCTCGIVAGVLLILYAVLK
jgi:phage shock protein PspC (stress-responsive transcriptional regulator)